MKNFKKIIAIVLLCAMSITALASCSEPEKKDDVVSGTDSETVESTADTEAVEIKKESPFESYYDFEEGEEPLDRLVVDGGLCTLFQTVAVSGDSLAAGQFEQDPNDTSGTYPDTYPYAWGAYMARDCGFTVHNFARGGLTAREYVETWANNKGFWSGKYRAQAYIIALGYNDYWLNQPVGTLDDINHKDYTKNADSFVGDYAQIIQHYKEISPDAFFFLVTKPRHTEVETNKYRLDQREAILAMAEEFEQCYVIDLHEYAPVYDADFQAKFFLRNHMNPMGYRFTAQMIESYIDYYIRKDPAAFYEVGFMNTGFYTLGDKAKK